mmetsp:Transcript_9060/g.16410  ORF Transcript_9060/g.16410 Transcript_9060/m.16410 type:complete len:92 (-) Transcript_9060:139-414(-)
MIAFLSSSERRNMVQSQGFSGIIRFFEGYGSRKAGIVEGIQSWESGTSFATIFSFNCSTFASSATPTLRPTKRRWKQQRRGCCENHEVFPS